MFQNYNSGLVMSLGWLKSEDLTWDDNGAKERGTWEYKVPTSLDIPKNFSARLTNVAPEFDIGNLYQ